MLAEAERELMGDGERAALKTTRCVRVVDKLI
jgi:hypothetical protein